MVKSRLIPILLGVAILCLAAPAATAQTDPRLVAIVQLAQDGRTDSARSVMKRLLDEVDPADSSYAEVLFTSGIVAGTEYERRIALRRVIVEYSTSAWADDALLLIGQVEYANGNPAAAAAQFTRLLADYPVSPLTAVAAFWGARAAGDIRNGAESCRLANVGLAAKVDDIELRNQLDFQKQRCTAMIAQGTDTGPPPQRVVVSDTTTSRSDAAPPPSPAPAPAAVSTPGFRVQVLAAPNRAAADERVAILKRSSFYAVVVEEGGYFKVRVGPYPTRAEANAALARIRARFGGKPFIVADR